MCLDPTPFRPGIGIIMMVDIGDQRGIARLVDDQADIAIDPGRPEIRILALVEPMQLEAVTGRVHLQVKYACLNRLLVLTGQAVECSGEGVSD
jgi:hypothetical protein